MNKVTMIFGYETGKGRAGGWSESWYYDGDLTTTQRQLTALCFARAGLLPSPIKIVGQRIALTVNVQTNQGRSVSYEAEIPGSLRLAQDIPQMALLAITYSTDNTSNKRFTLRGLPDDCVQNGDFAGNNGVVPAFSALATALGRGFYYRSSQPGAARFSISSIDVNGNFVLNAPMTFVAGNTVQLFRVKDITGRPVSGKFRVAGRTDDTHGQLANWQPGIVVNGSGSMKVLVYSFVPVIKDNTSIERAAIRKVGRPLSVFHGRARTAR